MSPTTPKSILIVGITPTPPPNAPELHLIRDSHTAATLQQQVTIGMQRIRDAGYDLHNKMLTPPDFADDIAEVRRLLQSRDWDGYMIGFGVRGVPEYTVAFEELVNAGRELAPGTRMGFNSSPGDMLESLARNGI